MAEGVPRRPGTQHISMPLRKASGGGRYRRNSDDADARLAALPLEGFSPADRRRRQSSAWPLCVAPRVLRQSHAATAAPAGGRTAALSTGGVALGNPALAGDG